MLYLLHTILRRKVMKTLNGGRSMARRKATDTQNMIATAATI